MRIPLGTLARTIALGGAAILGAACGYGYTRAQIQMDLPPVLPPLVVVEPGVQVVEDYREEIFFVDGSYWVRRDGHWYRTRDPYARWAYAPPNEVPAVIVRAPPGRYANWRRERHEERHRGD